LLHDDVESVDCQKAKYGRSVSRLILDIYYTDVIIILYSFFAMLHWDNSMRGANAS